MNNTLYIIRGLPGSGKSTYARKMLEEYKHLKHFEADMYFYQNGHYIFDALKLNAAHAWCLQQVKTHLEQGESVIVSNTFTQLWEMKKYIDLARRVGADIVVYRTVGNFKNIHGVPDGKIELMNERWEPYSQEIIIE